MSSLIAELSNDAPVILDGAWGTQLQSLGLPVGECPEIWNLRYPDRVESVARAYVAAGSRVVLTNSFGGNRFVLGRHGHAGEVREINRRAAAISRDAAGAHARVFASVGPSGRMLRSGDVTEGELSEVFEEQAEALVEGGADGFVIETMSDPDEAAIAVRAAARTGLPVVGCMVFDTGRGWDRTATGATVAEAVAAMTDAGAHAVGANCGRGITGFVELSRQFRAATELPLWIKANAGLPTMMNGKVVYRTTPAEFVAEVPALRCAGVGFIGGCCGTDPEFIRALVNSCRAA